MRSEERAERLEFEFPEHCPEEAAEGFELGVIPPSLKRPILAHLPVRSARESYDQTFQSCLPPHPATL